MARILFIHIRYPEFDRCSGDVRVTNMLRLLSQQHEVSLHVMHQNAQYMGAEANRHYAELLAGLGVRVESGSLVRHLRRQRYDAIVIEFWYVANPLIALVRTLQPQARVLVDTEHIYFYSDQVREAALGGGDAPELRAQRKATELAVYGAADAIITTTDEDRDVVLRERPQVRCRTIPNIHALPDAPVGQMAHRVPQSVIFVGNFKGNPSNVDAMLWFCREVMPALWRRAPEARLRIVGNMPPAEVQALAGAQVEVTGFVPETAPWLDSSVVSVCPLRFGAGLKGKIGEAMMHGLPVVSTRVGTQGMSPVEGQEILVADEPEAFAAAIARLFDDAALWCAMSQAGRQFIERHFGMAAVQTRLDEAFADLGWMPPPAPGSLARPLQAARLVARDLIDEHVMWRLRRS